LFKPFSLRIMLLCEL